MTPPIWASLVVRLRYGIIAAAATALSAASARSQQPLTDSNRLEIKARLRAASPVLASRRSAIDVAQARRIAKGLLPPVTLSAEVEEVPNTIDLSGAQSMRLDLSREMTPRSQRTAARTLADIEVERSQIELELAERLLDATVDQLLVRAAGNAVIANRLASEDSLLRSVEEALRARFAVADARYVDVLRLRTARLRVSNDRRRTFADYIIARGQLVRLAPIADTAAFGRRIDSAIAYEARGLTAGALAALPSVDSIAAVSGARRLSANAIRQAEANQRLARAEGRPMLVPSLGLQRFGDDRREPAIGVTLGLSVTLPFTARAANQTRIAVADRELAFAHSLRAAADATLASTLTLAAERYEVARAQLESYDATLLLGAREEREAALAAYRAGAMSLLELLDFERALAQAEVSRIRSHIDAAEAWLQYVAAAIAPPDTGGVR